MLLSQQIMSIRVSELLSKKSSSLAMISIKLVNIALTNFLKRCLPKRKIKFIKPFKKNIYRLNHHYI